MAGTLPEVVLFLSDKPQGGEFLVFDDATGRQIDVDIRTVGAAQTQPTEPKGPGRPRLGVVARDVTLLPRQWDWLAQQPGVEEAARALFAYDRRRFGDLIAGWPEDVRDFAVKLAFADQEPTAG